MRCSARTTNSFKRCKNKTKFIFCHQHKGWWIAVVTTLIITLPGIFSDYNTVINFLFSSKREFSKPQSKLAADILPTSKVGIFKVIILPFNKTGFANDQDYGKIIHDRLIHFNERDSLDAEIVYLAGSQYSVNMNQNDRDSLLKVHQGDFLVWGDYTSEEGQPLISLKYYSKAWPQYKKLDAELAAVNVKEFSMGEIQGDIDYILYNCCGVINYRFLAKIFFSKAEHPDHELEHKYLEHAIKFINYSLKTGDKKYVGSSYGILGTCYLIADSLNKSIQCFEKYLKEYPKDVGTLSNLALCYAYTRNFTKAFSVIDKAININPSFSLLYFQKAAISRFQGDLSKTILNYSIGLSKFPNDDSMLFYRHLTYYTLAQRTGNTKYYDSALSDLSTVIKFSPQQLKLYKMRYQLNYQLKRYSQVPNDINKMESLDTLSYDDIYYRGISYLNSEKYDLAEKDLQTAIRTKPYDFSAYEFLALTYIREEPDKKENKIKALQVFNKILSINPNYTNALFNRAGLYISLGDFDAAQSDLTCWKKLMHNVQDSAVTKMEKQINLRQSD